MIRRLLVIAFVSAGLAGCGDAAPRGATESAARLLAAAAKGDRVAFEAEIDRPAVRDDVRRQMSEVARSRVLDVEGGPSEFALDRMIGPDAVHLVRAGSSQALTTAPGVDQIAGQMKAIDGNRACLADARAPDRCLLTFARAKGGWRLVGMQASDLRIEVSGD
ncbi:hypothetical protein [Phenylobacterium sp.]|jgi:hypothetical protein|uniref:hypothetical protein n=1 Tax=Phenylobacterium sp. TaxID=1871053 RepID=UPI0037C5E5B2